MKHLFYTALTLLFVVMLHAAEHPFDEATAKRNKAQAQYDNAEKSFLKAVESITNPEKKKATLKAFEERKLAWKKIAELETELKIAASPAPDTFTSSSLTPYWTEVHYLGVMRSQLDEKAHWIVENWKVDPK